MQHGVAIGALIATWFDLGKPIAEVQGVPSRWRLSMLGIAHSDVIAATPWRVRDEALAANLLQSLE
jgi:hypothetical protein